MGRKPAKISGPAGARSVAFSPEGAYASALMLAISIGLLYWDLFVSLLGMGFFMYGKKRPDMSALGAGIVLMIYPYFVGSVEWSIAIGVIILVLYVIVKKVIRP